MEKKMSPIFRPLIAAVSLTAGMVMSASVLAAGSTVDVQAPPMNVEDQSSLQRGAKYFMSYCSGCHSLQYMRFNRLAKDIGITDQQGNILIDILKKDLMFGTDKEGNPLTIAMTPEDGKKWFGVAPPDLTLEAKLRGSDWIYGFLTSFYSDPETAWGVNNLVYPGVAMPNILGALQGQQLPVYQTETFETEGGNMQQKIVVGLKQGTPGELSPEEFDQMVYDIVNFLTYTADPGKTERHRVGVYVLLFLIVFTLFAYLLKREYWRDVH
jgi:ubiquinol-cytochrome c reductase cytochrome c1 subunit